MNDSAKANENLLSGNGDAALEMHPPTLTYRSGGGAGSTNGARASGTPNAGSRCAYCRVCGVVTLSLVSVAVLILAVFVAYHQYDIGRLRDSLNSTSESSNFYGLEIRKLQDELIGLKTKVKILQTGLEAMANGSGGGGKFDFSAASKLDYAKLDALNDANDDNKRQEALEMITPFKTDATYTSDPEFLRRLATVQYFQAMSILATNPNAKSAALDILKKEANVTIYKAYELSANKSALLYKWMGVIEGKYGTLDAQLKINDRVMISLRAYKWLKQSADQDPTDPGTFLALGNWYFKVTSLGGLERTVFNTLAGSAKPPTSWALAVQSYNQSVVLYEASGRQRIAAYYGLARALYQRNSGSGSDRVLANQFLTKAKSVPVVSADDRLENAELSNGVTYIPK